MSEKPSVLLVLTGESYRSGPQCSRRRGTHDYMKRQMLASLSHVRFIEEIEKKGFHVDVVINSYVLNEKDDTSLVQFYKKKANILFSKFNTEIFPSEKLYLNQMYDSIQPYIQSYEYVILLRIDYFLKDYFFTIFTLYDDKIQFSHIDSAMNVKDNIIHNVNHCFIIIPKKFNRIIQEKLIYTKTHEMYKDLRAYGFSKDNFHFMIHSLHVCSTDLGWNPLYCQVGRDYTTTYNVNNIYQSTIVYYYNKIVDRFIYDPSQTIGLWTPLLLTDSLQENLQKITVNQFEDL